MLFSLAKRFAVLLASVAVCISAFPQPMQDEELLRFRERYGEAREAIERGRWTDYERLRGRLDEYPLALYLDYFQLRAGSTRVTPQDARRFVERSSGSPLARRFLGSYLATAGRQQRWGDFLAVMPELPNDITLQCYYFRAQMSAGNALEAWQGAARLWVSGQSRPKECDPLFDAWMAAGGLTDRHVWQRLLLVFDAGQSGLLAYVGRKASDALSPWVERLSAVFRRPDTVLAEVRGLPDSGYRNDIVHSGIRRLAVYNPEKALDLWAQAATGDDEDETVRTEKKIAFRSLLNKVEEAEPWLQERLPLWRDDQLTEMRLRWFLARRDWSDILQLLPVLSDDARNSSLWQYWRGRALRAAGNEDEALVAFGQAARQRDYYGFLAADTLGVPYQFHDRTPGPAVDNARSFLRLPGVRRVNELQELSEPWLAQAEWRYVLEQEADDARLQLAQWAADSGWHYLAIDAANSAAAHDALALRFPQAYRDVFAAEAAGVGVTATELMSIARRESAFFPLARSSADARGLMQLLPQTGREVSRKLGLGQSPSLYDVASNVRLGSTYYRELLDLFDNNRPMALAAYNAGPRRVQNWRNRGDDRLPVDLWVETIPYRETRDYVKAVLAYNVVYGYVRGEPVDLLRPAERVTLY